MVTDWQLSCLHGRIASLISEIRRVAGKDHPYAEPRVVYESLVSVLLRHAKLLKDQTERFRASGAHKFLDQYFESAAREVANVAHVFSLVDRVDSSRIPFEILRALSWAAEELVGVRGRVVVRLDPINNYSIVSMQRLLEVKGWRSDFQDARRKGGLAEDDILLLGIPSAYAYAILLNALSAHEMGHLLFYSRQADLSLLIDSACHKVREEQKHRLQDYVVSEAVRQATGITDAYARTADAVVRLAFQVAQRWSIEIYSDLVAARLLGPAFLAAFDRVIVGGHAASASHPPTTLRRRLVFEYIERFLPNIAADRVWESLKPEPRQGPARPDIIWSFAEQVCNSVFRAFAQNLDDVVTPLTEEPSLLSKVIAEMELHVFNLSPPSVVLKENGLWLNSQGFWAMFYAAWHFRFNESKFIAFAKEYGWESRTLDAEAALGNLVLQGLKSLELENRWRVRLSNEPAEVGA